MSGSPVTPPFARVRRLGLFGGSFDLVHLGHEHVARTAAGAFALERIVWVPAARPPHKPERILADAEERLAMLDLALAGEPSWTVSRLELGRAEPSYTIDTVRALPAELGCASDVELFLLIGGDNLVGFAGWREVEALLARVQPIVVVRRGDEREALAELVRGLPAALVRKVERGIVAAPPVPISSTELRERFARGEPVDALLSPRVAEYIRARGLYRPRSA